MNNQNFSEKESLELISQMIQQSKKNMEIGSENVQFYYGYPAVALSILVYFLVHLTHHRCHAEFQADDLYAYSRFPWGCLHACFAGGRHFFYRLVESAFFNSALWVSLCRANIKFS